MKLLIICIIIMLAGCEIHYDYEEPEQDTEETDWDTEELVDTETEEIDSDCLGGGACTVTWYPSCMTLTGSGKQFLRHWRGCTCVGGVEYHVYEDQMCLEGCVEALTGANYCKEDEKYTEQS